jgi:hypothetical protein
MKMLSNAAPLFYRYDQEVQYIAAYLLIKGRIRAESYDTLILAET